MHPGVLDTGQFPYTCHHVMLLIPYTKQYYAYCLTFAVRWDAIPHGYRQAGPNLGAHQLEPRITSKGALGVYGGALLGALQCPISWDMELLARFHC